MTSEELAKYIDHTLLAPEATSHEITNLCAEARKFNVSAVCFSPSFLPLSVGLVPAEIAIACVVGFPSGAHAGDVKAFEATRAIENGATEIDMVLNLGFIYSANWLELGDEVAAVRKAISTASKKRALLKVIIESSALTDQQIIAACRVAVANGADFVKTSTGFHKSGGATVHAVELMRLTVGDLIGVKASGGIRTRETALEMINAGATRLGTSATGAILAS
ncbi:MAG: deoxyribose-phosphate aldolase [Acidimicrobiaceae bacterium]|nr:deoxyribose-phosphate aldolase [Acidimicrobiaceae bacterium]